MSGESCPQDLVARWHRPGRRFLNVYGPTEATVTATWTVLHPGRPVTIGVPLPTYSVVILDPDSGTGAAAGRRSARSASPGSGSPHGYLNRPDLTERAFMPDFLGMPDNPSGRIYRTGDLGRINADGEIEHHGRIDTQVKIRGYRIELTEIESVLLRAPGIAQAVVSTYEPEPGVVELVAYYSPRRDARRRRRRRASTRTCASGCPATWSRPTWRARRSSRCCPATRRTARACRAAAASVTWPAAGDLPGPGDRRRSGCWPSALAAMLGVERVSADGHFFDELGASSLLMARFSAALRERPTCRRSSMQDIYQHPTVRRLAAAIDPATARHGSAAPWAAPGRRCGGAAGASGSLPGARGKPRFLLCGALQLLAFAGLLGGLFALALDAGFRWATGGHGALGIVRPRWWSSAGPAGCWPRAADRREVAAHRPLEAAAHPVWSLAYFRFWLVKSLIVASPLARLSVGTPLYDAVPAGARAPRSAAAR